jgi:uncharacterized protein YndB with AHSA1/START domain
MTMPRNKDLKRLVRVRMRKTGEAYTAARAQVLRKPSRKSVSPSVATPPVAAPDLAAQAGMRDEIIREKTGRSWKQWVDTLDGHGAARMSHRDIATLVHREYGVPGWWTQSVTVGYERIKGLRVRGQRRDGSYEAGKSRTFNVPVARLYRAWVDASVRRRWADGAKVRVRTAIARKSLRLDWSDGTEETERTILAVGFEAKGASKSMVALAHTRLRDRAAADRLKRYWTQRLDALAKVLS